MSTVIRLTWGLADQAVSSMTNFAVGVFVAKALGPVEFGVFSLAWVTYTVVLNISRGVSTDPLVVRFSGVAPARWGLAVSRSTATALQVGLVAGALCVAVGLILGSTVSGSVGTAFAGLGVVLPALMLQDSWRFAFFAAGLGKRAFGNDMVRGVALVPLMVLAAQHGSMLGFLLAWGGSAAVAAGYGWWQTGLRPAWSGTRSWLRDHRELGPRYLVENVSISGATQLRAYGLGAVAGLADVGAVRGAELLLGPFLAVLMGLSLVAVPEAARMLRRGRRQLVSFCRWLGGIQAGAALLWGVALLVLVDDDLGRLVLGDVWPLASELIVPVTLDVAAAGLMNGAAAGVRALGAARRSLRAQLITAGAYLTAGLAGAVAGGAAGSAWGVAVALGLGAAAWWWQLAAGLREHDFAAGVAAGTGESAATRQR